MFKQILEYIHSTISEIRRAPKPFIAAVDGIAAAGGLGIAMSCDIVIASERATFEWAYEDALTGAESSTFMLPAAHRPAPRAGARSSSTRGSTRTRARYGLVTVRGPDRPFDDECAMAARLAAGPTASVRDRQGADESVGRDGPPRRPPRSRNSSSFPGADGAEFAEGLRAFFEKRASSGCRQARDAWSPEPCMNTRSSRRCSIRSSRGAQRAARLPCTAYRSASGSLPAWTCGLLQTAFDTFRVRTLCERAPMDVESGRAMGARQARRRRARPPADMRGLRAARAAGGRRRDRVEHLELEVP